MELSNKILSEITVHMKYARYLEDKQRRETWHPIKIELKFIIKVFMISIGIIGSTLYFVLV